ncbi:nucleoside phosphorylase [Clostridium paridis]|uniref:Uridine phosphorylase n=1 Tax=Clostridium paridis TaxID=2803863 RepID=A0A937FHZ0_9CLOT|nr:nucleoside phosphorylase [Clostridium paridis]MBL4931876.1 nucleoside phosphorylase [Clostridium paridis]
MGKRDFPILEFDGVTENIIEPSKFIKKINMSESVVMCFYSEVIEKLSNDGRLKEIKTLYSQIGKHPIYELDYKGKKVTVFHPGVGAALGASLMEEVIALGGRKFISCGSGGVLDKDIAVGNIIVPNSAIRDEGTSYHYVEPSREISINNKAIEAIEKTLKAHKCNYILAKTWSTDSFYRETKDMMKLRKDEGCLVVEMECSAFCAVAEYRNVIFGQMIYSGDDISCEEWNSRSEVDRRFVREALFWFSVEASLQL